MPLCEAVVASDPLLFRKADAQLRKAILALSSQPLQSADEARTGIALLENCDASVRRMIGQDSVGMLKSHLSIILATALVETGDRAEASKLLTSASRDLKSVSDKYELTRDRLLRRATSLNSKLSNSVNVRR